MKTYPKYKESGIPWIGQIPEDWNVLKTKHIASLYTGNSLNDTQKERYSSKAILSIPYLPYVATKDVSADGEYVNYENGLAIPLTESGFKMAPKDSFLLCVEGGSAGKKRAYLSRDVYFVNKLCCFVTTLNSRYHYFYIQSAPFLNRFQQLMQGLIGGVSVSNLNEMEIPVPSLSEQQAIAEYLDKKTGDIDELVGLLNKQIADVRAYRQCLITETVTQGLNKDVPMKDSGIEWIGQIPKGWHLTKLKHLTSKIGSGITPTGGATIYQDSGILFIRSQNVYTDGLRLDDVAYISDKIDNNMQSSRVLYGDVLLNITGASIGRCTTFNLERTRANVNQHVCIIRPIAELLLSKYLQYTFNSNLGQTQIALYQTGGNREGLNFEQLKNFLITDIPLSEQQQIVEFLDAKTKDIDELLSKLEAQVADLLAYKSSLISEVVTGKIDIR